MSEIIKFNTAIGTIGMKVRYFDKAYQKERVVQLCSRQDPRQQGYTWAKDVYRPQKMKIIVYGIGVGYHIQALQELVTEEQEIVVIEANQELMITLEEENIIKNLETHPNTKILKLYELQELAKELAEENITFSIYQPALQIIPDHMVELREILESYQLKEWNTEKFSNEIAINIQYHRSQEYLNSSVLYGSIKDKPIVVVSAGPSLSQSLEILKEIEDKVFVLATGRVLKTLLQYPIKVDMFCIIDAQELTYHQIASVEDSQVPFVFLNTVCEKTVSAYKGPKYIAYNMDSDETQEGRLDSGGSVATACIDLAIKLGGNPIILVGQDLAYTDGTSHAKECFTGKAKHLQSMRQVQGINGWYYPTTESLLSFKRWIEWKVQSTSSMEFINATTEGAYIRGCKHISLEDLQHKI